MGLRPKQCGRVQRGEPDQCCGFALTSFGCPSWQSVWPDSLHKDAGCRSQVRVASQLSAIQLVGINTLVPNFSPFPPASRKREVGRPSARIPEPGTQALSEYIGFRPSN